MAIAIKPLRRRRRTTQRGKPMTQAQRWGKVVTTMPVPEGVISTSVGPVEPTETTEEESIDTKGYPTELILEVADLIFLGGYANEQAVKIIDLVTNWGKE